MAVNALTGLPVDGPKFDLVGPTVADDIRRAISRYGAEAVKNAVKEATKAKRGRKKVPDWRELRHVIEADARDWLTGNDPFVARSNYAIAKAIAERNPGQSAVSTHKRIMRKLSADRFDRRWFTLVSAENQSRDAYSYLDHIRTLEALSELPDPSDSEMWRSFLDRARATVADYEAREGEAPPAEMTYNDVEEAVRNRSLEPLIAPPQPRGLIGARSPNLGLLGSILSDAVNPAKD